MYAAAVGMPPGRVKRTVEPLQRARLLPVGPKGPGFNRPHWEAADFTNLAIGTLCADPVTEAARFVPLFRHLMPTRAIRDERERMSDGTVIIREGISVDWTRTEIGGAARIFGNTLGAHLDGLIATLRKWFSVMDTDVTFTISGIPAAAFTMNYEWGALKIRERIEYAIPDPGEYALAECYAPFADALQCEPTPTARIITARLPFAVIGVFADLIAATPAKTDHKTNGAAPARAAPPVDDEPRRVRPETPPATGGTIGRARREQQPLKRSPAMSDQSILRLSALPRILIEAGYVLLPEQDDRALRYMAANCRFPAFQESGRWHFKLDDLPKIAKDLGLEKRRQPIDA